MPVGIRVEHISGFGSIERNALYFQFLECMSIAGS